MTGLETVLMTIVSMAGFYALYRSIKDIAD